MNIETNHISQSIKNHFCSLYFEERNKNHAEHIKKIEFPNAPKYEKIASINFHISAVAIDKSTT